MPFDFVCACPPGYEPDAELVKRVAEKGVGTATIVVGDPVGAVKGADAVYADVWASMGQEAEQAERQKAFVGYQVNLELLALANPDCVVMHCLPAHRDEEITDEVMESRHSIIYDEAENRLHVQKAIMALLMG